MHVFTAVIVPGGVDTAQSRANDVLRIAARRHGADYWSIGRGWFDERFAEVGLSAALGTGVLPLYQLPQPIPGRLNPAALVTPDARWHWRPLDNEPAFERWPTRLQRHLDRHRADHCYVAADVHF